MSTTRRFLIQATVLSACLLLTTCIDYSTLQRLNASCSPRDTCSIPRDLDHPERHNCDCASLCALHGTCCIDSPFRDHFATRRASCRPTGPKEAFFMVDTCPDSYQGPASIRRQCEQNAKDWSDPFNRVPTTQITTHRTYKSVFCAICNGEVASQLEMWQVVLDCSSLGEKMVLCSEDRDYVLRNMVYVREKSHWGIWTYNQISDWTFRYLNIGVKVPDQIYSFVQECRPNLISDCHPDWQDDSVRDLCGAYMGVVYYENVTYRNVHCALCNYERTSGLSCYEKDVLSYKSPTMNFGILVDIDLRDGKHVGKVDVTCDEDQVFDPFSRKCRNIECPLPGFSLKNGICIKE